VGRFGFLLTHQIGLAPQAGLDHALEPHIEHVVQVQIAQQHADRPTLRGPLLVGTNLAILQHACLQPAPDQTDQARVADSMFDKAEYPLVTQTPEEVLQVRLQHPAHLAARDQLIERR
jgi:hypothetical protein